MTARAKCSTCGTFGPVNWPYEDGEATYLCSPGPCKQHASCLPEQLDLDALEVRAKVIASGAPYRVLRLLDQPRQLEYAVMADDGDVLARTSELIGTGDGISAKLAAEFYADAPIDILALVARVRRFERATRDHDAEIEAVAMLAVGDQDARESVANIHGFAVGTVRQLRAASDSAQASDMAHAEKLVELAYELSRVQEENERLRTALVAIADVDKRREEFVLMGPRAVAIVVRIAKDALAGSTKR
jgi:hypothetical protein